MIQQITQRIAIIILPFLLQACGGDSVSTSNAVTPSFIVEPSGLSDSVPLAEEKSLELQVTSLQARSINSDPDRIDAPDNVLLNSIDGITYVTWQSVANADFYSLYVGDENNEDDFQLLATVDANDVLQYPLDDGYVAYITATTSDVESRPSLFAASQLIETSRLEHAVSD